MNRADRDISNYCACPSQVELGVVSCLLWVSHQVDVIAARYCRTFLRIKTSLTSAALHTSLYGNDAWLELMMKSNG